MLGAAADAELTVQEGAHSTAGRAEPRRPIVTSPLALTLQREDGAPPLFRQIQHGIRAAILAGALGEGMRLQPEREMAAALGVNRTTVMRSYQELAAEGLVVARPGRGTVVAARSRSADGSGDQPYPDDSTPGWLLTFPSFGNGALGPDPSLLRDISDLSQRSDLISFAPGAPGAELIPAAELQSACNAEIARSGGHALGYGPVDGVLSLRESLVEHLSTRGIQTSTDEVMILSGATQGLALVARAFIEPGDEVVVEAPTYVGILQTFGAVGARLIGVPVDRRGIRLEELSAILARRRVRLIVVQPTLHNPTNVSMPLDRRSQLLALAQRFGVPILEDDAYGELWRDGSGPQPLKALDRHGYVIQLGTFSKTLAPALRIGWITAPRAIIGRLALTKQFADLQSGALAQYAIQGFMASGAYERHLAWVRTAYNERRQVALEELQGINGIVIESGSDGGFYLWCRLPRGLTGRAFAASAARAGVAVLAGEAFYPQSPPGAENGSAHIRLSYASQSPPLIREGLRRLAPLFAQAAGTDLPLLSVHRPVI